MVSETTSLDAAAVLAGARRSRREADLAEAAVLARAVEWGVLHLVTDCEDAATWVADGVDTGVPLGGEGVPLVAEFAIPELATALGLSTDSGRCLLADALELAYRLPRVWARVQAGELPAWRARRIARETQLLSREAAGFVDRQVAAFAHRVGVAQLQRLVEEAIARFMPETARERQARAADGRHFDIDHDQVSFNGTSRVHGELDLADALDLEAAISAGAAELKQLGSAESLDVRRSQAAGELARRQLALDLSAAGSVADETPTTTPSARAQRQVVLHVHLAEQAIRSRDASAPGRVENAGGHLVTAGQIADWCGADATTITVKPVVDLAEHIHVTSYEVPDRLAEQTALRDQTCVFPWCTRPAPAAPPTRVTPATTTTSSPTRGAAPPARATSPHCAGGITASRPTAAGPTPPSSRAPTCGPARTATPTCATTPAPRTSPTFPSSRPTVPTRPGPRSRSCTAPNPARRSSRRGHRHARARKARSSTKLQGSSRSTRVQPVQPRSATRARSRGTAG